MPIKQHKNRFSFVERYRAHNDALALKQMRERNSSERSTAEINEQLRQWRIESARRLGL